MTTLHNTVNPLQSEQEYATLSASTLALLAGDELEKLERHLIAIVQLIRSVRGLPPLMTGKQVKSERYG